jgi:hypothetical protein
MCGTCRNGGIQVHYSAGLASLSAVGGAVSLPDHGGLWLAARLLLDASGTLFGLYLVITLGLLLTGHAMRLCRGAAASGQGASLWRPADRCGHWPR